VSYRLELDAGKFYAKGPHDRFRPVQGTTDHGNSREVADARDGADLIECLGASAKQQQRLCVRGRQEIDCQTDDSAGTKRRDGSRIRYECGLTRGLRKRN
jgi:hypothetical protein